MLKLKLRFQNKKGFTLIELILGIAIMSMLIITLYTALSFSLQFNYKSIIEDELLLNGRYVLEYIKEEICSADKIISSNNFKNLDSTYPRNIGFVILEIDKKRDKRTGQILDPILYSYTTYYFQNDSIVRINAKKLISKNTILDTENLKKTLPESSSFSGYNAIGYNILKESKITFIGEDIISLDLFFKEDKSEVSNFNSNVFIRCEVVR